MEAVDGNTSTVIEMCHHICDQLIQNLNGLCQVIVEISHHLKNNNHYEIDEIEVTC